ncbi:MAG TPA: DUF883 family protein [Phycisphaerales bacterium]|jgi:ElaB/YqjD/DUF883 family membrane-anchored ribosome-binding protein|nr:DUF883 family protein [Phycisphaerales bacterium]
MVNPATSTGDTASTRGLRDDLDALKADLSTLKDDLRSFSSNAASAARHGADEARGRIGHATSVLRDKGRAAYDAAKEKGQWAKDEVEGRIQENPFTSVGIAFGVGILIGALIARR